AVISNPHSEIPNPKHQISGCQVSGANGKSLSNIQYLKSLNFSISQFLIPHSAFPNPKSKIRNQKRLHSLPLVVIFPVAFAYYSAADLQYPAGVTFGRYGGV
ncbi:MAG: hypothetical protein ABUK17_04745, partial [Syntrophobacteria bacterium]